MPYFLVAQRDSAGPGPTLLAGYGAFLVASTPSYLDVAGRLWLARGGTYALPNIRGGGEYGPAWHDQAVRANRCKVAEDFAALSKRVPGLYFFVGVTPPGKDPDTVAGNHSPDFFMDEDALPIAHDALLRVTLDFLSGGKPAP